MKRNNGLLKIISWLTLFAFVSTPLTWAEPANPSPANINQSLNLQSEKIIIPDALGTIQEQNPGLPEKPQIIFIQDAHAVVDAQINISALIDYFQERYGIKLVALEGGQGKIDTTLFKTFPDRAISKKVMQNYLDRAEINGAVLASVFNSNDAGYYGIEEWPLYEMNYAAYLRAMKQRDRIFGKLAKLREALDEKRQKVYSPELNLFHEKVQAFRDEQGKLMDLLSYINNSGEGVWQKDIRAGKYPHLKVLLDSVRNDARLSSGETAAEVRHLSERIKKRHGRLMDRAEAMEFNGAYQDFVTGRSDAASFLKYLIGFSAEKGKNLKLSPILRQLLGYADTLATIKGTKLFVELEDVLNDIEEGLITKKEEREISERYKKIIILKNLAALELTREELAQFSKTPEVYQELIRDRSLLLPATDFYRLALRRDSVLHENLERLMRDQQVKTAIVLAGGFHSDGFTATMKERGYSYVMITPRIKSLAGHERYEKVMTGDLSYKEYLKTTVYDAFQRHATLKLVSEMDAPDFRRSLKLWRDETIRRLAAEGRVASAGRYTRYLDLLIRLYAEKFGPESLNIKSKAEMIKAVREALAKYRENSLAQIWKDFEVNLNVFADSMQALMDKKEASAEKIVPLIHEIEGRKPSVLAASLGEVIPDLGAGILEKVVLGELDYSALEAWKLPVSMADIRDVLSQKEGNQAFDIAALPEVARGAEVLSRIAREGVPSNPASRQIAAKVVDEVIDAIRPRVLEQSPAEVDSKIASALKKKLDGGQRGASLGDDEPAMTNPDERRRRITDLLESVDLEALITDEAIGPIRSAEDAEAEAQPWLAKFGAQVGPVIDEVRSIYSGLMKDSLKRAERYPDQARRDQWTLTSLLIRNEANEVFLQPFLKRIKESLSSKGALEIPYFQGLVNATAHAGGTTFVSYGLGPSDLPADLSLADPRIMNDEILVQLTFHRWDDSGMMRDHEATFGENAVRKFYDQILGWSVAASEGEFPVLHRALPAIAAVNERGRAGMARYLFLMWATNLFGHYGFPDHATVDFAQTFTEEDLNQLDQLEKSGNPAYPQGLAGLIRAVKDKPKQYRFYPEYAAEDPQQAVLDRIESARRVFRQALFSYLDTPGFAKLGVAALHRLTDNPHALDQNELLPRALAILTGGGEAAVQTGIAEYLIKSLKKSTRTAGIRLLLDHFTEFPPQVQAVVSGKAGELFRALVYYSSEPMNAESAQKMAALFNHQDARKIKLSAQDVLAAADFMKQVDDKINFRFNGESVDRAFQFSTQPRFLQLAAAFGGAGYRLENKHLPHWAALLKRDDAESLEKSVGVLAHFANSHGYGLDWGYFEGKPGELENVAINSMPARAVLDIVPKDLETAEARAEFAVVIDSWFGLRPSSNGDDYVSFVAAIGRFRDILGENAEGFLHTKLVPLAAKLKARDAQLTIRGLADYLMAINHIEQAIHIPQPQATVNDELVEDDILIITEYLLTHVYTPDKLTGLFDKHFNSEAGDGTRKLDYHFFVTFMQNLVEEDETLVTPEAEIFFKLFTSKRLHRFYDTKKIVRRNANMLDASQNEQSVRYFRKALQLLNRRRSDYLGKAWRLQDQGVSNKTLDSKVDAAGGKKELSRALAEEFSGYLELMIDLNAVQEAKTGVEPGDLQREKEEVLSSLDQAAAADEKSAGSLYLVFMEKAGDFRETFAAQKAQILFQLFTGVVSLPADQADRDLADLKAYTERAPRNQNGDTVIDSMVQFVQSNRTLPEVVAVAYRMIMAEARGGFSKYRYESPDYTRMFAEWETANKPETDTEALKKDRDQKALQVKKNWQANQYYTTADQDGKKLHFGFTDNFATLLNLGNPYYFDSCQATYKREYSRGLAGTLANGWNKALVVYDDNGRFLARRIVRLRLTEKGEFVLLRERTYGFAAYEKHFDEMLAKVAHDMGVRYEPDEGVKAESIAIRLWGAGNSEWEYSDMYGNQFLEANAGLIRLKEGDEFKAYLSIPLLASSVSEMGQGSGLQYNAENDSDFKLIVSREQSGVLSLDSAVMPFSGTLAGVVTAASLGSGVPPVEALAIVDLVPGSNTWKLHDTREGGHDWYLKLDSLGRAETLGFRYANMLGIVNVPVWGRLSFENLKKLKFAAAAEGRWGGKWGDGIEEIIENTGEAKEKWPVLAKDIDALTAAELAVPESSGFEEMLAFLAFTDARDVGWRHNLERRAIGGKERFLLFDMTPASFLGDPLDALFTYNDEMIGRMYEQLDAGRLKAAIDRIKALSPDEFVRQALEAGYSESEIQKEGFVERQQNLEQIVANALMASVEAILVATGLPLFADSVINYRHINYLLDTPDYESQLWPDILKDLFGEEPDAFMELLSRGDDDLLEFVREKNPYFSLTLSAVEKTVSAMLKSIPAYGENALPGFKKNELEAFKKADMEGRELLRKVIHAQEVAGRVDLEESRLYQKILRTAKFINPGFQWAESKSARGASLGESVPFNELIAALRNHIGRTDSDFFRVMRSRILDGEAPIRAGDPIGRVSSVDTILPSFKDKHFPDPHEAVREIVTNAYDAMKGIPDPVNRPVDVKLGREGEQGTLEVADRGPGMNLNTILTKFLPPFQGEKRSTQLDHLKYFFDRTDFTAEQKLEALRRVIPSDFSEFSAFERAVFEDLKRKLDAYEIEKQTGSMDEGRTQGILGALRETVYSTGQFGIGFYSLLYFVREEGDTVEVNTVFGEGPERESYRITYLMENGKLAIRIEPTQETAQESGTVVRLLSKSFDKEAAQRVIQDFLSFDSNGKISIQMDEETPYTVNSEVFNSQAFESFRDGTEGVEVYNSRDIRRNKGDPKTRVYINVHGVTIFSQEIEGFGMPQKVVLNFPANIKLPISRNRLLADALFIGKAQAMIALMQKKRRVDLISAFYPLIENLQYKNARDEDILKTRMEQAVTQLRAWNESFVPNTEEFTKLVPDDRLFLVDPGLLTGNTISFSGALTPFQHDGQDVMLGTKRVYLADFTDDTKYVASEHAIVINRVHEPQIDVDRALFNVHLELSRQPAFDYYQPADTQTAAVSQPEVEPSGQAKAAIPVEELERRADQVLARAMAKSEAIYLFLFPIIQYGRGRPPDEFGLLLNGESDLVLVAELLLALNPGEHFKPSLDEYSQKEWFYQLSHQIRIKSEDDPGFWNVLLQNPKARDLMAAVEADKYTVFRLFSAMKNKIPDDKHQISRFIDSALVRLLDIKDLIKDFKYRIDEQIFLAAVYLDEGYLRGHREGLARLGLFLDEPGLHRDVGGVVADYFERDIAALRGQYLPRSLHKLIRNDFAFITTYEEIVAYALSQIRPWLDRSPGYILRYHGLADFLTGIASLPLAEAKHVIDVVLKENPDQSMYDADSRFRSTRAFLYYFYKEDEKRAPGTSEFADWQQMYETLKSSQSGLFWAESVLESDIPLDRKKTYVKQIVKMARQNTLPIYSSGHYYFLRNYFDFNLLNSMPENEAGVFLNFLMVFNPVYEDSFIRRKHEIARPGTLPAFSDYIQHRNEITGKLLNIFKIVRAGGSQKYKDFLKALSQSADYLDKWEVSQFGAELAPFVGYLLSSSDVSDVADEITVEPAKARNFRLIDLYDSWTSLPDVQTEGAESVSARINQAAALRSNIESGREARREFLAADFRSVAKQNVDLNVAARELVQNVIDETPSGSQGRVEMRTFRKEVDGRRLTVLDVKDEIGMDIERIYNKLLMPYSTTKRDPLKPSLGEQGQGFFTLLSNSEYVTIRSVRDGRGCKLRITPVRRYGEVIDYTVEDEELEPAELAGEANGTHIQAFINLGVPEIEAEMVTSAVGKYAGLVDPSRVLIVVNGTTVNDNRDRLLAQRDSPRGTVEFFSTPGISNVALGGLQFKAMDETFLALIPQALRAPLAGAGFSVNLPGFNPADTSQTIRRIQGGSEISERERVYQDIEAAVATGALESAVAMLSRGDIRNLDMIGYDYFGDSKEEISIDPAIVEDARSLKENPGSMDMKRIYDQYLKDTPESRNRLGHLLLAYPLDFLPRFEARKLSLMEFFNLYRKDPGHFPDISGLPEPLQNALNMVRDRVQREDGQKQSLETMGLPGDLLGKHFDVPVEMRDRAGAYDAFLSISDYLAQIAIRKVRDLVTAEEVGEGFLQRITELSENPPMANFYAAPDGLSMAHALQETSLYAWNILDAESLIKKLSDYLKDGSERQGEFLAEFAEAMTKILTHELTHLMEGTGEGTHDKLFHDRQKFLVSALIGAKDEIAVYLADLPARYRGQNGFVPVREFLEMMVAAGKAKVLGGKVIENDEPLPRAVEGASLGAAPLAVLTGFETDWALARHLEELIKDSKIRSAEELKAYLRQRAAAKMKEFRTLLETQSAVIVEGLAAAEDFFDALFDLEAELNGVANRVRALGIPATAEELASALRAAIFDSDTELNVKYAEQAQNTVSDDQLRLYEERISVAQKKLVRNAAESGQKFTLAVQHAGRDMQLELDSIKTYRQMIKLLIILHDKSQSLNRSDLSAIDVTTLPLLLDMGSSGKQEKAIRQAVKQMDSVKVPPLFIFTQKLGLNPDLSKMLLSILSQIDQVPDRLKKQAIDAVLLVIFSLALAGNDEREQVLGGSKAALEKLLADYEVGFLKDAFDIEAGGGMSLSIASFISSIVSAAQEQALTEKAA
ncbi:MAG: hypothetical protein A2036_03615 [Omnitrophica bacterium GWA2_50_21]|nr:MAG: hypothetical protein A2036_03615 [Omnitrophica bacterium GWA2_50_21]